MRLGRGNKGTTGDAGDSKVVNLRRDDAKFILKTKALKKVILQENDNDNEEESDDKSETDA